jgi:hypothetical protein
MVFERHTPVCGRDFFASGTSFKAEYFIIVDNFSLVHTDLKGLVKPQAGNFANIIITNFLAMS